MEKDQQNGLGGEKNDLSHKDIPAWMESVQMTAQEREDLSGGCQLPGQSGYLDPAPHSTQSQPVG